MARTEHTYNASALHACNSCKVTRALKFLASRTIRRHTFGKAISSVLGCILLSAVLCISLSNNARAANGSQQPERDFSCHHDQNQDSDVQDADHDSKDLSISGTITDSTDSKADLGGITMSVEDENGELQNTTTDKAGRFDIKHLRPGIYTVAPSEAGYLFSPNTRLVTVKCRMHHHVDFTRGPLNQGEGLSSALLEYLDTVPSIAVSPETTTLPDGKNVATFAASQGVTAQALEEQLGFVFPTPGVNANGTNSAHEEVSRTPAVDAASTADLQIQVDQALMKMLEVAEDFACGRNPNPCTALRHWNFPAETPVALNPAQTGLTYVYGGKTPQVRTLPTAGGCLTLTYGMDCSGLVYLSAKAAGLTTLTGQAIDQGNPKNWTVPASLFMEKVSDGSMKTGDIVVWASHDGIVDKNGEIISSTGEKGACVADITRPRGPRTLPFSTLAVGNPPEHPGLGNPKAVLRLTALVISPTTPTVAVGSTVTLSATDLTGSPVPVSWNSSDVALAIVRPLSPATATSGVVTGVAAGSPIITITEPVSGATGSVQITVTPGGNVMLQLSPTSPTVPVGQKITLSVTATQGGNTIPTPPNLIWTSSDQTLATVSAGVVTGIAPGSPTITVTDPISGASASALVTVTLAAGQTATVSTATSTISYSESFSTTCNPSINPPSSSSGTATPGYPVPTFGGTLPLIFANGSWLPGSYTWQGNPLDYNGSGWDPAGNPTANFEETITSSGLLTETERYSGSPAQVGDAITSVSATETLDLNTGAYTMTMTYVSGGLADCPIPNSNPIAYTGSTKTNTFTYSATYAITLSQ